MRVPARDQAHRRQTACTQIEFKSRNKSALISDFWQFWWLLEEPFFVSGPSPPHSRLLELGFTRSLNFSSSWAKISLTVIWISGEFMLLVSRASFKASLAWRIKYPLTNDFITSITSVLSSVVVLCRFERFESSLSPILSLLRINWSPVDIALCAIYSLKF